LYDFVNRKTIIKFGFDSECQTSIYKDIKNEEASVYAYKFHNDKNFNAIKIESNDGDESSSLLPSYSKVYKLKMNVELTGQIKNFIENDFMFKFNSNIDDLNLYKDKIKKKKGFSIFINSVEEGNKNLKIIEFDQSFHIESYTFDMK
jgi:hypothetical protein